MQTKKESLFIGGVPTEPDVKLLLAAFPDPQRGQLITHEQIEGVITVHRSSSRYRTVVAAWRRRLINESNLDTTAIPGVGIRVLAEYDRVTASAKDYRRGVATVGKATRRVSRVQVERLTEQEQTKAEHVRRQMEATLAAGRQSVKEIAIRLAPPESNPRLRPVK